MHSDAPDLTGKRITFVLGKPVRPNTIFPEVFDRLQAAGSALHVLIPGDGDPVSFDGPAPDLVVQRGLNPAFLAEVLANERSGIRHCNNVAATIAIADRALTAQSLATHNVPVPNTTCVDDWQQVVDVARRYPVVVKAADGSIGRGRGVLINPGYDVPPDPPFAGPWIVQDFIGGDGTTLKLYVAGRQVRGLEKRYPPLDRSHARGEPFVVDEELSTLSRQVGTAVGLEIYGIDVIPGRDGPAVVDVNPFPGFRGVPQGAQIVAEHIASVTSSVTTAED